MPQINAVQPHYYPQNYSPRLYHGKLTYVEPQIQPNAAAFTPNKGPMPYQTTPTTATSKPSPTTLAELTPPGVEGDFGRLNGVKNATNLMNQQEFKRPAKQDKQQESIEEEAESSTAMIERDFPAKQSPVFRPQSPEKVSTPPQMVFLGSFRQSLRSSNLQDETEILVTEPYWVTVGCLRTASLFTYLPGQQQSNNETRGRPLSDKNSTTSPLSHSAAQIAQKTSENQNFSENSDEEVERDWEFNLNPQPMNGANYPMSDTSDSPSPRNAKSEIHNGFKLSANCSEFVPSGQGFNLSDYRSLSPLNKLAGSIMAYPHPVAAPAPIPKLQVPTNQQPIYYPVPQSSSVSPPPRVYSPYPYGQSESPPPFPYGQSESPPPYMHLQTQNHHPAQAPPPPPPPPQYMQSSTSFQSGYQAGPPVQFPQMGGGTEIHVYHHHHHHPQTTQPMYQQQEGMYPQQANFKPQGYPMSIYDAPPSPQPGYYQEQRRVAGYNSQTGYDLASMLGNQSEMAKNTSDRRLQAPAAAPYSTLNLQDVKGKAGSLAKDQNGSRKIQNLFDEILTQRKLVQCKLDEEKHQHEGGSSGKLEQKGKRKKDGEKKGKRKHKLDMTASLGNLKPEEERIKMEQNAVAIFNQLLPLSLELIKDRFGNYVIQKLYDYADKFQLKQLGEKLLGQMRQLSTQMHGCRVVQKALETLPFEMQKEMITELKDFMMKCVEDQNGNHVIQKCIEQLPPEEVEFILEMVEKQILRMSSHQYGCRIIQRIFENFSEERIAHLKSQILKHTEELSRNQYGNYVVQHLLVNGTSEDKSHIANVVRQNVFDLGTDKYASNVIEKCLTYASEADKKNLLLELCLDPENFRRLMTDNFGNYVLQICLKKASKKELKRLIECVEDQDTPDMGDNSYARHVITSAENERARILGGKSKDARYSPPVSPVREHKKNISTNKMPKGKPVDPPPAMPMITDMTSLQHRRYDSPTGYHKKMSQF